MKKSADKEGSGKVENGLNCNGREAAIAAWLAKSLDEFLRSHLCQVKTFFISDEDGNLFDADDDGTKDGYLEVTDDETGATMTFSPQEIDELEKACRASRATRPMRVKRATRQSR
jgi:hypothetical protein